jgi:hypothetical protein
VYWPGQPAVIPNADARQAPWVELDLIDRCGALLIARTGESLETGLSATQAAATTSRTMLAARDSRGHESSIQAALIAPTAGQGCR